MAGENDTIDNITIVGGGDAGLMTALILKRVNSEVNITVVDNFDEDIPEIGKSTYVNIQQIIHDVIGVDQKRFFSEVKPVWKASVYFEDWCGQGPFQVPFDHNMPPKSTLPNRKGKELYYRYETQNFHTLGRELAEKDKSPFVSVDGPHSWDIYDNVAYHLPVNRFNQFLRELCSERQVELVDDEIIEIRTNENKIESVASDMNEYTSDLFVDATGFKRLLMRNLENEFIKFDFPLDSAVVAKTELALSDIVPATVINSGDYGWFWQIDTFDFRDLGYVYSSEHVSNNEAKEEFIEQQDAEISESDIQQYRFDSGFYNKGWINNCVAVGNALGFVEPLQSTALSTNGTLAKRLSELLAEHYRLNHPEVREIYNSIVRNTWNAVYDFISIHYIHSSGDTEFWKDVQYIEKSDRSEQLVERYRGSGFNAHDVFNSRHDDPFPPWIHYLVLNGLGVEVDFYENIDIDVDSDIEQRIEVQKQKIAERTDKHLSYEDIYLEGVYD